MCDYLPCFCCQTVIPYLAFVVKLMCDYPTFCCQANVRLPYLAFVVKLMCDYPTVHLLSN